jgi:hypothetical protein
MVFCPYKKVRLQIRVNIRELLTFVKRANLSDCLRRGNQHNRPRRESISVRPIHLHLYYQPLYISNQTALDNNSFVYLETIEPYNTSEKSYYQYGNIEFRLLIPLADLVNNKFKNL